MGLLGELGLRASSLAYRRMTPIHSKAVILAKPGVNVFLPCDCQFKAFKELQWREFPLEHFALAAARQEHIWMSTLWVEMD